MLGNISVLILMDLSTCDSLLSFRLRLLASLSGASFLLLDSGQQTPALMRVGLEISHGKMCAEAAVIETQRPLTCLLEVFLKLEKYLVEGMTKEG